MRLKQVFEPTVESDSFGIRSVIRADNICSTYFVTRHPERRRKDNSVFSGCATLVNLLLSDLHLQYAAMMSPFARVCNRSKHKLSQGFASAPVRMLNLPDVGLLGCLTSDVSLLRLFSERHLLFGCTPAYTFLSALYRWHSTTSEKIRSWTVTFRHASELSRRSCSVLTA